MVFIQVCVGSSCHLKGSQAIVNMMQQKVEADGLGDEVILSGSFCTGKCNRVGVTITVNDNVFAGVTPEGFLAFWNEQVSPLLAKKGE